MRKSNLKHNFIKAGSLVVAAAVTISSVAYFVKDRALTAEAMKDTLPGVEELRNEYIYNTKTYRILEIVPDMSLAEIGYYFGEEEPFATLYNDNSKSYDKWKDKLLTIKGEGEQTDSEARIAFMQELLYDAEAVSAFYGEAGAVPFTYEQYVEYDAETAALVNANTLAVEGRLKKGYLVETGAGNVNATFKGVTNRDISLDEINNSVTTAYYKAVLDAEFGKEFSIGELKRFAELYAGEKLYVLRPEGHLEYAGTAEIVWQSYLDAKTEQDTETEGDGTEGGETEGDGTEGGETEGDGTEGGETEGDGTEGGEAEAEGTDAEESTLSEGGDVNTESIPSDSLVEREEIEGAETVTSGDAGSAAEVVVIEVTDPIPLVSALDIVNAEREAAGGDDTTAGGDDTTAGGDDTTAGGDDTTAGGDDTTASEDEAWLSEMTGLYYPHFVLVNANNPVVVGDYVYLLESYDMVEAGTGEFTFVEAVEGVDPYDEFQFETTYIYYTGGITNNELIRNQVFGLTEGEYSSFRMAVETVTPAMLNEIFEYNQLTDSLNGSKYLAAYDMVYINGGSTMNTVNGTTYTYFAENDLNEVVMASLAMYITTEEMPCIFDLAPFINVSGTLYQVTSHLDDSRLAQLAAFLIAPVYNGTGTNIADSFYSERLSNFVDEMEVLDMWKGGASDPFAGFDTTMNRTDSECALTDGSFVNLSTWFVCNNGKETGDKSLQNRGFLNGAEYSLAQIKAGFYRVWDEIRVENMYREEQEGKAPLGGQIFDYSVLRYIVNYKTQRQLYKDTLNVLCIEPATRNSNSITVDTIKKLTNAQNVNITVWPMNEFVGKIDDLSATFDMIYIGASTDRLNVDSSGATIYNDSNMNGLLYSHVGDLIEVFASVSGLLDTDYTGENRGASTVKEKTAHRYTGNDLSLEKYNHLMEYLDAYYPVVVDDALVQLLDDGRSVIDSNKVDNSSYLYEFLKHIIEDTDRKNVFTESEMTGKRNLFSFYVNRPKLSVYSHYYPNLIMNTEFYSTDSGENRNVTQVRKQADGKYYLEYDFVIQNDSAYRFGENYTCKLYLDANADGKFSEGFEELTLSGVNIYNADTRQPVNSVRELKAGVHYQVSREVPDTFFGCITWQLEISQTNCPTIRCVNKGYTKLDNEGVATTITVLQVYLATSDNRAINLEESIGSFDKASGKYKLPDGAQKTKYFQNVAQGVSSEYILDITTIPKSRFDTGYFADGRAIDLNSFDMLILGFSDAVNNGNDWKVGIDTNLPGGIANNNIMYFIESGKSVLFAHDMTSTINVPRNATGSEKTIQNNAGVPYAFSKNAGAVFRKFTYADNTEFNEYDWGYSINTKLRDLVGMDIYGITSGNTDMTSMYRPLALGLTMAKNSGGNYQIDFAANNALLEGSSALSARAQSLADVVIQEPQKANGLYLYGNKEVAYAPKSGRQSTVAEVQGMTAYTLKQRSYRQFTSTEDAARTALPYRSGLSSGGENSTSWSAEKVNDGQITNYPYVIDTMPSIRVTHNQYYALDLNGDSDKDNQTDIVVWYTMKDGQFDYVPGDVKNNYYIYSKGNVIYTGMGHAASKSDNSYYEDAVTEVEAKLFINTMIAAYNTGKRTPEVISTDGSGLATNVVYNYYDALLQEDVADVDFANVAPGDEKNDVYFYVDDLNMTQGIKTVQVRYYMEVTQELVNQLNGESVKYVPLVAKELPDIGDMAEEGTLVVDVTDYLMPYTYEGNRALSPADKDSLNAGVSYRVEIPLKYFSADTSGYKSSLYIGARTRMVKNSIIDGTAVATETEYAYKELQCVNVELFDLD